MKLVIISPATSVTRFAGGIGKITGDINKRPVREEGHVDLYVAGFPCQPFSLLGAQEGFNDKRGQLIFTIRNVIRRNFPKSFLLGNVANFAKING